MRTWENVLKNEEDKIEKGLMGNLFQKVKNSFQNFRASNKLRTELDQFDRAIRSATKGARFKVVFDNAVDGMPRYMGNEKTLYLAGFSDMAGQKLVNEFEEVLSNSSGLQIKRQSSRVPRGAQPGMDMLLITVTDERMIGSLSPDPYDY